MNPIDPEKHPAEGIEMLSEPLLTEEGFINEACLKQLEGAINSMPETHERLKDNPEWKIPAWVTDTEIVGALSMWAISQSDGVPENLEKVCKYTLTVLRKEIFKQKIGGFRMEKLSLCQINKILWDILGDVELFNAWNDDEQMKHLDWIDLSALLHNVCISIRNDRRHSKAFDIEFELRRGEE